eukprot:c23390_g2_i2 orf=243-1529(-)
MSASQKLHTQNASEAGGRPVLRPAGNTTTVSRTPSSLLSKPAVTKAGLNLNKGASPKPSKPNPHEDFPRSLQNVLSDGQREDGEKMLQNRRILGTNDLGCKKLASERKATPSRRNSIALISRVGITNSHNIAGSSPWSSIGSLSLEEVPVRPLSVDSSLNKKIKQVNTGRRVVSHANKQQAGSKVGRVVPDVLLSTMAPPVEIKKRCGWITPQSDPAYVAYHDMEWGVPVHDDRTLFELLVLVGALAEFSWPVILSKREAFRAAFSGFDPIVVAKYDEKTIASIKTNASIMQHEGKIRGIIENAYHILEIQKEFGSFDQYLWGFVNYKPIVSNHRYAKQVPVKTPKSESISKDLLKRGFRFVGPTVMHSFMQSVGMASDHLVTCFRHNECGIKSYEPQQVDKGTIQQPVESFPKEEEEIFSVAAVYLD